MFVKSALDREERDWYSIVVQAKDNPLAATDKQLTDSILVKVKVLDINDNAPRCEQTEYRAEPLQNIEAGAVLIQTKAVDPDLDQNAQIIYSLHPRNETNHSLFEIDPENGLIRTSRKLFGFSGLYLFDLIMKDHGRPEKSGNCLLSILIKDFNAHPPKFHYPTYQNSSFRIKTVNFKSYL